MNLSPTLTADVKHAIDLITEGTFYADYDEASRLAGVLRQFGDALPAVDRLLQIASAEDELITYVDEHRSIAIVPIKTDDGVDRWMVETHNHGTEIAMIYSSEAMIALVLMFYQLAEKRALAEEAENDLGNSPAAQRQMDALAEQHDTAVDAAVEQIALNAAENVERHLTSDKMIWGLPDLPELWMTELRSVLVAEMKTAFDALRSVPA